MYCPRCSNEIVAGAKFCRSCGAPVPAAAPGQPGQQFQPVQSIPQPQPVRSQADRYRGSAIALWIGAVAILAQIIVYLFPMPRSYYYSVFDYYYINAFLWVIEGVSFLCALWGIHAIHAGQAGVRGQGAVVALSLAWVITIVQRPLIPLRLSGFAWFISLSVLADLSFTIGYILLGLSFFAGKVYSTWIGIVYWILGLITFTIVFQSFQSWLALISFGLQLLTNLAVGWTLYKGKQLEDKQLPVYW